MTRMSEIPPELLAEMTPAVRAFVESWMLQMAEMQARMQAEIDDLKAQVKKLTPKNSSVPPSTQHPQASHVPHLASLSVRLNQVDHLSSPDEARSHNSESLAAARHVQRQHASEGNVQRTVHAPRLALDVR